MIGFIALHLIVLVGMAVVFYMLGYRRALADIRADPDFERKEEQLEEFLEKRRRWGRPAGKGRP